MLKSRLKWITEETYQDKYHKKREREREAESEIDFDTMDACYIT